MFVLRFLLLSIFLVTVYWSISGAFGQMVCVIDSLMRTIIWLFALPGVRGGVMGGGD